MNHCIVSKQNNVNDSHTLNKFVPKKINMLTNQCNKGFFKCLLMIIEVTHSLYFPSCKNT